MAKGIAMGIPVIPERTAQGNIRVSKPGDPDYVPQCETTRAFTYDNAVRSVPALDGNAMINAKRGKDIKTFKDLPPDVQATIEALSDTPQEKGRRTAIAINYQHLYPDRYHSTGCAMGQGQGLGQTADLGEMR